MSFFRRARIARPISQYMANSSVLTFSWARVRARSTMLFNSSTSSKKPGGELGALSGDTCGVVVVHTGMVVCPQPGVTFRNQALRHDG